MRNIRRAAAGGLTVLACSHFHSWLTPVAFAVRRTPAGRLMKGSAEEASFVSPTVNEVPRAVTRVERAMVRRFSVPAGLSVMLVGRNDGEPDGDSFEPSQLGLLDGRPVNGHDVPLPDRSIDLNSIEASDPGAR